MGIAHLSIDGIWLRVNARMCELVGYTREELLGHTFRDVTHPDDVAADLGHVEALLGGAVRAFTLEKRYVRKDGAIVWVDRTVSLVRGATGEPQYFISVVQDIGERKRALEAMDELTRTLEQRIAERTLELEARAREAERRADETAFVVDLMTKLEQEESATALMEHVCDSLCALGVADAVTSSIGTVALGLSVLAMKGTYPPSLEALRKRRVTPEIDGGELWEALHDLRSVWLHDYPKLPNASPPLLAAGLTAVAHVPFGRVSDEIGLLTAMRFSERPPWQERERALLQASARALSLALARAERIRTAERSAVYANALMQVSRLTEHPYDPMEMAQHAICEIARAADVDLGTLTHAIGERVVPRLVWSNERASPELILQIEAGASRVDSMAWQALLRGEALFVDDYAAAAAPMASLLGAGMRSFAMVPLGDPQGEALAFVAIRSGTARPWTEPDRELFLAAARSVRLAVQRRAHLDQLEQAALTDPLTGLANRRALGRDLTGELSRAARHGQPVSVVSLDLDGLKLVNDAYGHASGDLLISTFADLLRACLRREDRMYRVGGDEFVLLLPHVPGSELAVDAIRARIAVAMDRVRAVGFPAADVSAGFATYPEEGRTSDELLALSDWRMYAEKATHRSTGRART